MTGDLAATALPAVVESSDAKLDTLMVIVPDKLSELMRKGEIVPRYYNPGNLFKRVHIVMTSADVVDPAYVQPMVGDAELTIHSVPSGRRTFLRSWGWRPFLLRAWAKPIVALAERVRPALVRCHGNHLNGFAAAEIKRRLGIPYVISLHGNPDVDYFRGRRATTWTRKLLGRAVEAIEILGVRNADFVIAVYSPIVPYLRKHRILRWAVIHNAVGYGIRHKEDYALGPGPVKVICVGRQQSQEKDPSHIVEAVADLANVQLTLVGTGDLHAELRAKVAALGISDRVIFHTALPNERVLELYCQSDLVAYCSHNYEISKGSIEAALTGLPIVLNDRDGNPAEELVGPHFMLVPDSREGYRGAMRRLIEDAELRERLGRAARSHALAHWRPETLERRVVELYRSIAAGQTPSREGRAWANSSKQ